MIRELLALVAAVAIHGPAAPQRPIPSSSSTSRWTSSARTTWSAGGRSSPGDWRGCCGPGPCSPTRIRTTRCPRPPGARHRALRTEPALDRHRAQRSGREGQQRAGRAARRARSGRLTVAVRGTALFDWMQRGGPRRARCPSRARIAAPSCPSGAPQSRCTGTSRGSSPPAATTPTRFPAWVRAFNVSAVAARTRAAVEPAAGPSAYAEPDSVEFENRAATSCFPTTCRRIRPPPRSRCSPRRGSTR